MINRVNIFRPYQIQITLYNHNKEKTAIPALSIFIAFLIFITIWAQKRPNPDFYPLFYPNPASRRKILTLDPNDNDKRFKDIDFSPLYIEL
jgi:hypothetical protein